MLRRAVTTAVAALAATGLMLGAAQAQSKKVKIAYVEWSDAIVATNIVKTVLESKGYDVTITPLAAAAMWQAVATGEADAMVAAWLPDTHASYYGQLKDKVDLIGPNVTGAKIGWPSRNTRSFRRSKISRPRPPWSRARSSGSIRARAS